MILAYNINVNFKAKRKVKKDKKSQKTEVFEGNFENWGGWWR